MRWLIIVVPLLLVILVASGLVLGWYVMYGQQPDIGKLGGTILVYEVDQESSSPDSREQQRFTAIMLKRRIDPADIYSVTVRMPSPTRVEIIIVGTGEKHDEHVHHIKDILASPARLEFCILASEEDDHEAIEAAKRFFDSAQKGENETDKGRRLQLELLAKIGKPPPPPLPLGAGNKFKTEKGDYTYRWVEYGRVIEVDPRWKMAAQAREQGQVVILDESLIFSRPFKRLRATEQERNKRFEYFVLVRNAEDDSERLLGKHLKDAYQADGEIRFSLTPEGGKLFEKVTAKNIGRRLAIELDGQIMSVATIRSAISSEGRITVNVAKEDLDRYVSIFQAGVGQVYLKPVPISETTVEPKANR